MRFCALPTNISVASRSSSEPVTPVNSHKNLAMTAIPAKLTLSAQHCRLHRRQNLQLRSNCRNSFANLQQVCSNSLVGALARQLFGQPGHVFGRFGDFLGGGDQFPFAALGVGAHQFGEAGHEDGHAFGGGNDFVVLGRPLADHLVEAVGGDLEERRRSVMVRALGDELFLTKIGWLAPGACRKTSSSSSVSGRGGRGGGSSRGNGGRGGGTSAV
jgi:hypothetical protein